MADVTIYQFLGAVAFLSLFFACFTCYDWVIGRLTKRFGSALSVPIVATYLLWFLAVIQTMISLGVMTIQVFGVALL